MGDRTGVRQEPPGPAQPRCRPVWPLPTCPCPPDIAAQLWFRLSAAPGRLVSFVQPFVRSEPPRPPRLMSTAASQGDANAAGR